MTAAVQNLESGNVASYKATAALTANTLVKYDTSNEGQVVTTAAITDIAIGVVTTSPAAGDMCEVQTGGVAKVTAAGAIAIGAEVCPNSATGGRVIAASGQGATARVIGIAESAAGGAGEVIRVRLKVPNLGGPANT